MAGSSIPNKVFVGCPFKNVRAKYVRVSKKLSHSFPIYFFLMGQERDQKAQDLLETIKQNILTSSEAIFDVTSSNANVSLEYGFADGSDIQRSLYMSDNKRSAQPGKENSIIADLAGQTRNHYKNEDALEKLLRTFCKEHPFTKRFEKALARTVRNVKNGHKKKKLRTLGLKIIHYLDGQTEVRRDDLVNALAGAYDAEDIEFVLTGLRVNKLISSLQGPHSKVQIRQL